MVGSADFSTLSEEETNLRRKGEKKVQSVGIRIHFESQRWHSSRMKDISRSYNESERRTQRYNCSIVNCEKSKVRRRQFIEREYKRVELDERKISVLIRSISLMSSNLERKIRRILIRISIKNEHPRKSNKEKDKYWKNSSEQL